MSNKPRSVVRWMRPKAFEKMAAGVGVSPFLGIEPHEPYTLRVRLVEEPERYYMVEANNVFYIYDREGESSPAAVIFRKACHPYARAAAEAECARLNAGVLFQED